MSSCTTFSKIKKNSSSSRGSSNIYCAKEQINEKTKPAYMTNWRQLDFDV